ncbi:MAG: FadR/GntR family transcriptional regulator [Emergencia sp.]
MDNENILNRLAVNEIKTQSDYLADRIKGMIVTREIDDGFVFPNENEFCRILNVSRATLREAYKILDTQGFIRRTKHGTYVKSREDIARQGNFAASLELADTAEMEEFVCALEPEAVFLAAKKINETSLEELEQLMLDCEAAGDNSRELIDRNYRFHAYIRSAAGNHLISSALTAYYDMFSHQVIENIYRMTGDVEEFRANSLRQHREIFDALKRHDGDKAKELAYRHLLDSVEFQVLQLRKG